MGRPSPPVSEYESGAAGNGCESFGHEGVRWEDGETKAAARVKPVRKSQLMVCCTTSCACSIAELKALAWRPRGRAVQ